VSIRIIERNVTAGNQLDGSAGASSGNITVVAESALALGSDYFTLDDKDGGPPVDFHFVSPDGFLKFDTTPLRRPVYVDSGYTATQVRDSVIIAINAAVACGFYAGIVDADQVALVNRFGGTRGDGDQPADNVADGGFVISTFSSGADHAYVDYEDTRVYLPRDNGGQFDFPSFIPRSIDGAPAGRSVLTWGVDSLTLEGTAATLTIRVVSPSGAVFAHTSSATTPFVLDTVLAPLVIPADYRLQLVTASATGPIKARVAASPRALAA
jgi:hypothetical protein